MITDDIKEKYSLAPADYRRKNTPRGWDTRIKFFYSFYEYSTHPIWKIWSFAVSILLSIALAVVLFLILPPFMAASILGLVTLLWATVITHLTMTSNGEIKLFGIYGIVLASVVGLGLVLSFIFSLSLGARAWLWGGLILVSLGFIASIVILIKAKIANSDAVLGSDLLSLFLPICFFFEMFTLLPTILYPICFPLYKRKCERLNSLFEKYEKGFDACVRECAQELRGAAPIRKIVKRLSATMTDFFDKVVLPENEGDEARFQLSLYISKGKIYDDGKIILDLTDLYDEPFESVIDFHAFCRALADAIKAGYKKNAEVAVNFMEHDFFVSNIPCASDAYINIYLYINVPEDVVAGLKTEE